MTAGRLTLSLLAAAALLAPPVSGQSTGLQEILDARRLAAGAPGAILGVLATGGRPVVVASGALDLAGDAAMRSDQPYYLGSISKTYTATVVLRLAESGQLSLDDAVSRFLPDFPRGSVITVRQLLDQTSGLKDFYSYMYFRPDRNEMIELVTRSWTEAELLELAGRFGHWSDPGTEWSYSSTNYYLLGVIVERASGLSLADAYRRYIYEPLGIEHTWLAWHEPAAGPLPPGHLGPVQGWDHSEMFGELGSTAALDRSPVEWGAGGLAATARDALTFLDGLLRGELVADSTLHEMLSFRPTPPLGIPASYDAPDTTSDGYGLGLVKMERRGLVVIGHGGLFTGHTAGLWHVPACGLTISVYFNRGFVGQRELLDAVLEDVTAGSEDRPGCLSDG